MPRRRFTKKQDPKETVDAQNSDSEEEEVRNKTVEPSKNRKAQQKSAQQNTEKAPAKEEQKVDSTENTETETKSDNESNETAEKDDATEPQKSEVSYPLKVEYCSVCGFPYEYCSYGTCFEKCKAAHPDKHTEEEEASVKQKNKVQKTVEKAILLSKVDRTKRKCCTIIDGLENFGHNLNEISKTLRKQLSCGVCIKDTTIEVQGNCLYELAMFANKELKIKASNIFVVEKSKKICIKEYPFEK